MIQYIIIKYIIYEQLTFFISQKIASPASPGSGLDWWTGLGFGLVLDW